MIIFMGLAGSGKSTMGQLLAAHLRCPWVSTGHLLRAHMDKETQKQMLRGEIISDDQTLAILDTEFRRIGAHERQFILDGTPRTMRQAEWLVNQDQEGGLKINAVIHLEIKPEKAKERLLIRRRPDDYEQAIAERFREYEQNIKPIIKYLTKQGYKVHDIDADQKPEKVEQDIEEAMGI